MSAHGLIVVKEMTHIVYHCAMCRYCEGGDLYTRLKQQKSMPLEERQIVEWFVQIAMALQVGDGLGV